MTPIFLLFELAVISFPLAANEASIEPYVFVDSFSFSETSSISQIAFKDFEGDDFAGGEHSFTRNRFEIGYRYGPWRYALLTRYDYALDYTRDAAFILYADKNDLAIPDKLYDAQIEGFHVQSTGFLVGADLLRLESFRLSTDLSFLRVSRYLDGSLDGRIETTAGEYSGTARLDYSYERDVILERQVNAPSGYGFSLSFDWTWQLTQELTLSQQWRDIYSELRIDDAPFTRAQANSDRISLDPDGTIDVKPLLAGIESFRDEILRYPDNVSTEAKYKIAGSVDHVAIAWHRYNKTDAFELGLSIPSGEHGLFSVAWIAPIGALKLAVSDQNVEIAVALDDMLPWEARTIWLSWSWHPSV